MNDPKFLLDEMLGSLVRWLRILGFDTCYGHDFKVSEEENLDSLLIEKGKQQHRILVTKDVDLAHRAEGKGVSVILLHADDIEKNLEVLVNKLDLHVSEKKAGKRCPECNTPFRKISKEAVREKVPPRVEKFQEEFWICPKCKKIFWKGKHWNAIRDVISNLQKQQEKEENRN